MVAAVDVLSFLLLINISLPSFLRHRMCWGGHKEVLRDVVEVDRFLMCRYMAASRGYSHQLKSLTS
jgi:hypothetical protein